MYNVYENVNQNNCSMTPILYPAFTPIRNSVIGQMQILLGLDPSLRNTEQMAAPRFVCCVVKDIIKPHWKFCWSKNKEFANVFQKKIRLTNIRGSSILSWGLGMQIPLEPPVLVSMSRFRICLTNILGNFLKHVPKNVLPGHIRGDILGNILGIFLEMLLKLFLKIFLEIF